MWRVMIVVMVVSMFLVQVVSCGEEAPSEELPRLRIKEVIEVTKDSDMPSWGIFDFMQPVWSPDGEKLAFTRFAFTGLYVKNADGSGEIKELTGEDYTGYEPVWTTDSKGIVMRTRKGIVGQRISCVDIETGEVTIIEPWVGHAKQPRVNRYGGVVLQFDGVVRVFDKATGRYMSAEEYYSGRSDSLEVVLEMDHRAGRLWIVRGGERWEFPYSKDFIWTPRLSPKGDKVLFDVSRDSKTFVANIDGSGLVELDHGGPWGDGTDWQWSPDGKRIVYCIIKEGEIGILESDIYVVNADGTCKTKLTDTPEIIELFPRWSPDGMKIAYSTDLRNGKSDRYSGRIYVAILEEVK